METLFTTYLIYMLKKSGFSFGMLIYFKLLNFYVHQSVLLQQNYEHFQTFSIAKETKTRY